MERRGGVKVAGNNNNIRNNSNHFISHKQSQLLQPTTGTPTTAHNRTQQPTAAATKTTSLPGCRQTPRETSSRSWQAAIHIACVHRKALRAQVDRHKSTHTPHNMINSQAGLHASPARASSMALRDELAPISPRRLALERGDEKAEKPASELVVYTPGCCHEKF